MKNFILLCALLIFCMNASLAAEISSEEKKDAFRDLVKSHQYQHETCIKLSRNFKSDNRFSNYLRNNCLLYESDRQRMLDTIFPITNNGEEWYKDQYPVLKAQFAIQMNNREVENYRMIVSEYCKYNSYKYKKKDPEVCSEERINSMF